MTKYMSKKPGTSFSRNQKIQRQESHRIGVGAIGVLLIDLTHSKCSYSTPLLNTHDIIVYYVHLGSTTSIWCELRPLLPNSSVFLAFRAFYKSGPGHGTHQLDTVLPR